MEHTMEQGQGSTEPAMERAPFTREAQLSRARADEQWDLIIIGGGATGLGAAVDAASRGYKTLLLERDDYAKGTSSRSTKLVHGGVRYLKQGNISLVNEALRERGRLRDNAPHLVRHLSFIVPNYDWWEGPFYGVGLKLYDLLAGKMGLKPSRHLSKDKTLSKLPNLNPEDLRGGVMYYDGQFDDARLSIHLALTAYDHGAALVNYCEVVGFVRGEDGITRGVEALDRESGERFTVRGRVVINATGVFVDHVRQLDEEEAEPMVAPSQGVHVVLPGRFLNSDTAIMVPQTADGRVLFAIPWYDKLVVGTTDTAVEQPSAEPRPLREELEFILTHAQEYLEEAPTEADVLSCFAGLRPLVSAGKGKRTAALSRDHTIHISRSGLITITGGKWTTYRKMAEDVIDEAVGVGGLEERACVTPTLKLHGWREADNDNIIDFRSVYGADLERVDALLDERPELAELVHPRLPYRGAEIVWAAREEMARTLDDALARRTRSLLLDARAALEAAPKVAQLMAQELGHDEAWVQAQITTFTELAEGYLCTTYS
jgi:glycerol-3-phosphate dehydrogenase